MSQYKFKNDRYIAQTGYDRPLKYFFLTIYEIGKPDDQPRFCNISHRISPGMTIAEIREELQGVGMNLPEEVEAAMIADQTSGVYRGLHIFDTKTREFRPPLS
jgi:hypothetical protein